MTQDLRQKMEIQFLAPNNDTSSAPEAHVKREIVTHTSPNFDENSDFLSALIKFHLIFNECDQLRRTELFTSMNLLPFSHQYHDSHHAEQKHKRRKKSLSKTGTVQPSVSSHGVGMTLQPKKACPMNSSKITTALQRVPRNSS